MVKTLKTWNLATWYPNRLQFFWCFDGKDIILVQEMWAFDDLRLNEIMHIKWEQLRQRARMADRWFGHPHLYVLESSTYLHRSFKASDYGPTT